MHIAGLLASRSLVHALGVCEALCGIGSSQCYGTAYPAKRQLPIVLDISLRVCSILLLGVPLPIGLPACHITACILHVRPLRASGCWPGPAGLQGNGADIECAGRAGLRCHRGVDLVLLLHLPKIGPPDFLTMFSCWSACCWSACCPSCFAASHVLLL